MTCAGAGGSIHEFAAQGGVSGFSGGSIILNSGVKLYADDSAGTNNNIVNIGALSGSGTIYGSGGVGSRAGTKTLTIGALNSVTTFSGIIANTDSGGAVIAI